MKGNPDLKGKLDLTSDVSFRRELQARLLGQGEKVLLRVVVSPDFERPVEFTGRAIVEGAADLVRSLTQLKERSVVFMLLPHSPELFLLHVGLVLEGHIPAILAWPTNRVDAEKYQRNLVHQLVHLPADRLVTLPELASNLAARLPYQVSGLQLEVGPDFEKPFPVEPVNEGLERQELPVQSSNPGKGTLFLQFSGGTTGAQKAIVVSEATMTEQLQQLAEALQFNSSDEVVSWLPMYHDMGLIACFWMPLWHGATSVQIAA